MFIFSVIYRRRSSAWDYCVRVVKTSQQGHRMVPKVVKNGRILSADKEIPCQALTGNFLVKLLKRAKYSLGDVLDRIGPKGGPGRGTRRPLERPWWPKGS